MTRFTVDEIVELLNFHKKELRTIISSSAVEAEKQQAVIDNASVYRNEADREVRRAESILEMLSGIEDTV